MKEDINQEFTGLRERPTSKEFKKGIEHPYHMTSVLQRLFPEVKWSHNYLKDSNKRCIQTIGSSRIAPDFWNTDLVIKGKKGVVIEIDGDSLGQPNHFSRTEVATIDIHKDEAYHNFGFENIIRIPPYIQLDSEMVTYYFGELETAKQIGDLYPAVHEHGFAHPDITLPADFCEMGIKRFMNDMECIPNNVRKKIIGTLLERINEYQEKGFSYSEARSLVLPQSLIYLIDQQVFKQ